MKQGIAMATQQYPHVTAYMGVIVITTGTVLLYRQRRRRLDQLRRDILADEEDDDSCMLQNDHCSWSRQTAKPARNRRTAQANNVHATSHPSAAVIRSQQDEAVEVRIQRAIREGLREVLTPLLNVSHQEALGLEGNRTAEGECMEDVVPAHTQGMALCHPSTLPASCSQRHSQGSGRRRPAFQVDLCSKFSTDYLL